MAEKGVPALIALVGNIGHRVNNSVQRLGFAARFFLMILVYSGQSFRRLHLTIREIYFSGFQSLLIILVSGLFIGMVLGMQGYETLQRYGSSEALGVLVALSLTRELGPVVAALLFASRAGSSITAEIGLMKATEQLTAMDMMAVNPIARVVVAEVPELDPVGLAITHTGTGDLVGDPERHPLADQPLGDVGRE